MSKSAMKKMLNKVRDFAKIWATHRAPEVCQARLRAEILAFKIVAEKLDSWIADRGHAPENGHWKLVAREIGISPEAFHREMARRRGN